MRRLFDAEAAKRTQLNDPGEIGVDRRQAVERVIEREDGHLVRCRDVLYVLY